MRPQEVVQEKGRKNHSRNRHGKGWTWCLAVKGRNDISFIRLDLVGNIRRFYLNTAILLLLQVVFLICMEMIKGIKSTGCFEAGIKVVHKKECFYVLGAETFKFILNDQVFRVLR